ncbi:MAG: Hsp20/alpha crystallin family protein [Chloroflexi bacterium]|nr:Hsp20/alpha crystallin family protein [Chloroflexota bacterium]
MPIDEWQREMERYLAHFSRSAKRPRIVFTQYAQPAPVWTPAVDMFETESELVAVFDLAGVDASQTEVRAEAHTLTVRGVRRPSSTTSEQPTYYALEIAYGRFERTIELPAGIDTNAAKANYREGLLEVRLPKRAPRQVRVGVREHREQEQAR